MYRKDNGATELNVEEEYVLLKYIELLWSSTGSPPRDFFDILAKYNIRTVLDLDEIIHKLHKKIIDKKDTLRTATGDIEYIEYILETVFHSSIVSSRGDGISEPGYIETRHLNALIKITSPNTALIVIDTDYEVPVLKFADDCLEDFKENYFDDDVEVVIEGRNIWLKTDMIDLLRDSLRFLGDAVRAEKVIVYNNVLLLTNVEDVHETLELIREAYNSYIAYVSFLDTDKTVYKPIYLEKASSALEELRDHLIGIAHISFSVDDVANVHLHENKVHVHGRIDINIETRSSLLLPFIIAGAIASVDESPEYEEKHFRSTARQTARIIINISRQIRNNSHKEKICV